jgi:hypothetical protein
MPTFLKKSCLADAHQLDHSITHSPYFLAIASAVGGQEDLIDSFANVGYLVLASCFGMGMQFLVVHVVIYYLVTKTNPFITSSASSGPNHGLRLPAVPLRSP